MEVETKIIYHIDDEDTPYLVKVPVPPSLVTLGDFKNVLNKPGCKYFFKSMDDDFGVVKEEITDDAVKLPCFNGRVVSWLVTAEGSDAGSHGSDSVSQKGSVVGQSERQVDGGSLNFHNATGDTETESSVSSRRGNRNLPPLPKTTTLTRHDFGPRLNGHGPQGGKPGALGGRQHQHLYQETTNSREIFAQPIPRDGRESARHPAGMMSSDLESTSYWESDDDLTCSRFSSATTETTSRSKGSRFKKRRRKHRVPPQMDRASSFSSITDSTLSLNIITVTLNMDTVNFLGISIVGQSNKGGDGGIYVGSIMKGGAVAQDGRIEPGDMILQVNEVSLENMSNDEAVGVLRDAVQKPAPIKLVVAKCWDPSPRGYFTVPHQEPVRPIDPSAWVAHTEAVRLQQHSDYGSLGPVPPGAIPLANITSGSMMGVPLGVGIASSVGGMPIARMGHGGSTSAPPGVYPPRPGPLSPSLTDLTSTSSCFNSAPEAERLYEDLNLTTNTDMTMVAKSMAMPDSGLEIRDRMWLKITIPNAFIGSDVVDWLFNHVAGFSDRRDARKYATQMLKQGFIRHTVNKSSFSEQCYYVMSPLILELCGQLASLNIDDNLDSVSERAAVAATIAGNAVIDGSQCRHLKPVGDSSHQGGPIPMSCPPTTYYQGPPYMMGGPGGGPYAPPPLGYTPMPYVTGNYAGEGVGFRGVPTTTTAPMVGFRATGVGGSEASVASGNSNASSNSMDSVCVNGKKDVEGTEVPRHPQRLLTPSAPAREFLDSEPTLNSNNITNNNHLLQPKSPTTTAINSPPQYFPSPLLPSKSPSTTPTQNSNHPSSPHLHYNVPFDAAATPTVGDGGVLPTPLAPRPTTEGGGGVGERPPTGGGVGESPSPSPPPPPVSTSNASNSVLSRFKPQSSSSGNPPSYHEAVTLPPTAPPPT